MKPGEIGEIRTETDPYRAVRRMPSRDVTNSEELVDQLIQGRSRSEMKITLRVVCCTAENWPTDTATRPDGAVRRSRYLDRNP
jgi:hypothetical protein